INYSGFRSTVCLLPVEEGPCRADLPRFYYNTLRQKCERFYYGGCQGNANNFHTYQECHKTCFRIPTNQSVCHDQGPCRALLWRYFYNMSSLQCEPFYYGGCHGNANRFTNMASCTTTVAPGRVSTYTQTTVSPRKSESLHTDYFLTHRLLLAPGRVSTVPVLCLDSLDSGSCSASIPRFYYNPASRMCEEFKYSGCGGSSNNFVSRQSCMDVCHEERVRVKFDSNQIHGPGP
uniref:Tissue factor pathway inhibitor n=1 Tax=Neogobius melanostomus TaxID=47308 RepID=A0A8C6S5W5_9GOBI